MLKKYQSCQIDIKGCINCGCDQFSQKSVIDTELAECWGLSIQERQWLDEREGHYCLGCKMTKRVRMLLWSIKKLSRPSEEFKVLHLNQTNNLSEALRKVGQLTETTYQPKEPLGKTVGGLLNQDICRLTFRNSQFDLVIHSEILEHLHDYQQALSEVQRVLKPGGIQIYTVPILFSRITRRRSKLDDIKRTIDVLPPSFHGCEREFPVVWEFGIDFFEEKTNGDDQIHFDDYWYNQTVFTLIKIKPG
mgnify:FL=1